jgi:hypothetical protein
MFDRKKIVFEYDTMERNEVTLVSPLTRQPNKVTCFNRIGPANFFF